MKSTGILSFIWIIFIDLPEFSNQMKIFINLGIHIKLYLDIGVHAI